MSNLIKRAGGVYYFRARIPTHLVSAYGRSMVSLSLSTTDKAVARERAAPHREQLDRTLEGLGQQRTRLDDGYQGALLHLTASRFATDELERIKGMSADSLQLEMEIYQDTVRLLRDAFAQGKMDALHVSLDKFLREIDIRVVAGTPPYERLARAFQQAEIEVYSAIVQRRKGESVDIS